MSNPAGTYQEGVSSPIGSGTPRVRRNSDVTTREEVMRATMQQLQQSNNDLQARLASLEIAQRNQGLLPQSATEVARQGQRTTNISDATQRQGEAIRQQKEEIQTQSQGLQELNERTLRAAVQASERDKLLQTAMANSREAAQQVNATASQVAGQGQQVGQLSAQQASQEAELQRVGQLATQAAQTAQVVSDAADKAVRTSAGTTAELELLRQNVWEAKQYAQDAQQAAREARQAPPGLASVQRDAQSARNAASSAHRAAQEALKKLATMGVRSEQDMATSPAGPNPLRSTGKGVKPEHLFTGHQNRVDEPSVGAQALLGASRATEALAEPVLTADDYSPVPDADPKGKPPTFRDFTGTEERPEQWLQDCVDGLLDRLIDRYRWPVAIASAFKGAALTWWHLLRNKHHIVTWPVFKQEFLSTYRELDPASEIRRKNRVLRYTNLSQLNQGTRQLYISAPLGEFTQSEWIDTYLSKLPTHRYSNFMMSIKQGRVRELEEVLRLAEEYEGLLDNTYRSAATNTTPTSTVRRYGGGGGNPNRVGRTPSPFRPRFQKQVRFGGAPRMALNATTRESSRPAGNKDKGELKDIKCFNCGIFGHYARDCRKPNRKTEGGPGGFPGSGNGRHLNVTIREGDSSDDKDEEQDSSDVIKRKTRGTKLNLPIIQTAIKNTFFTSLVDTGASDEFISTRLYNRLVEAKAPFTLLNVQESRVGTAFTGKAMTTMEIGFCLRIGHYTRMVRAFVIDFRNPEFDCVLGMPFLTDNNVQFNWKDRSFTLDDITEPSPSPIRFLLSFTQRQQKTLVDSKNKVLKFVKKVGSKIKTDIFDKVLQDNLKKDFPTLMGDRLNVDPAKRSNITHSIELVNDKPIRQPPRRKSPKDEAAIKKFIEEALAAGTIRPSNSSWSSPLIMVPKPNGDSRPCVDYRLINSQTVKDAYPIPRTDDTLDLMTGARYFTGLDLKSGYWQIPVKKEDVPKTAFSTKNGMYEFLVMPFGLCNAPATFQRAMNSVLHECLDKICTVYLDDITIFSKTPEDHIEHVWQVARLLDDAGFVLGLGKCYFGHQSAMVLGHVIDGNSIRPNPAKIEAIMAWPIPKNITDVRGFLNVAGYYRRFIKGFAKDAGPLYELTKGSPKKGAPINWTPACTKSFEYLKKQLSGDPLLAQPDFTKRYFLESDASQFACGSVLSQVRKDWKGDGTLESGTKVPPKSALHPIAFFSKRFTSTETNYSAQERELLGIMTSLKHFRYMVEGAPLTVITDHESLKYLRRQREMTKRLLRFIETIEHFDPTILYRKGGDNTVADALSRRTDLPEPLEPADTPLFAFPMLRGYGDEDMTPIEEEDEDEAIVDVDDEIFETEEEGPAAPAETAGERALRGLNTEESDRVQQVFDALILVRAAQGARPVDLEDDRRRASWRRLLPTKTGPEQDEIRDLARPMIENIKLDDQAVLLEWKQWDNVMLPTLETLDDAAGHIIAIHQDIGHKAAPATHRAVEDRYAFPESELLVRACVDTCEVCQVFDNELGRPRRLHPLPKVDAFDRWGLDFVVMPKTAQGNRHLVTAVDYCTSQGLAEVAERGESPEDVIRMVDGIINQYGKPSTLVCDNGAAFTSNRFMLWADHLGIRVIYTSAYHPQTNGKVEKFNGLLTQALSRLAQQHRGDWDQPHILGAALMGYRATRSTVTGQSPFQLMFGREPRLRSQSGINTRNETIAPSRLTEIRKRETRTQRFEHSRAVANVRSKRLMERRAARSDQRAQSSDHREPSTGDLVLIRGRSKTQKRPGWTGPYMVSAVTPEGAFEVMTRNGLTLRSTFNTSDVKMAQVSPSSAPRHHSNISLCATVRTANTTPSDDDDSEKQESRPLAESSSVFQTGSHRRDEPPSGSHPPSETQSIPDSTEPFKARTSGRLKPSRPPLDWQQWTQDADRRLKNVHNRRQMRTRQMGPITKKVADDREKRRQEKARRVENRSRKGKEKAVSPEYDEDEDSSSPSSEENTGSEYLPDKPVSRDRSASIHNWSDNSDEWDIGQTFSKEYVQLHSAPDRPEAVQPRRSPENRRQYEKQRRDTEMDKATAKLRNARIRKDFSGDEAEPAPPRPIKKRNISTTQDPRPVHPLTAALRELRRIQDEMGMTAGQRRYQREAADPERYIFRKNSQVKEGIKHRKLYAEDEAFRENQRQVSRENYRTRYFKQHKPQQQWAEDLRAANAAKLQAQIDESTGPGRKLLLAKQRKVQQLRTKYLADKADPVISERKRAQSRLHGERARQRLRDKGIIKSAYRRHPNSRTRASDEASTSRLPDPVEDPPRVIDDHPSPTTTEPTPSPSESGR